MEEEYTDAYLELSERHQAFVDEYAISRNATEAYQKVYDCSYDVANAQGPLLKKKPGVAAAIVEAMEASAKRCEIDQDWVLTNLKEGVERCMQHSPVLDKQGKETGEYTFQAGPMFKGIELAGKNLGMFKDTVVSTGPNGGPVEKKITVEFVNADNPNKSPASKETGKGLND